ncbi:MAG: xylan 1,4-beta-xylosidase [Lachnospiraceae bacterium]|nr:xylan 1,4-beta-xylosidase [Lachnospiraceae bacterium]
MVNKTERFIKVYSQPNAEGNTKGTEIWLDRVTGVNYLFCYSGYAESFTPLLDKNGKPIITPLTEETRAGFHWNNEKVG